MSRSLTYLMFSVKCQIPGPPPPTHTHTPTCFHLCCLSDSVCFFCQFYWNMLTSSVSGIDLTHCDVNEASCRDQVDWVCQWTKAADYNDVIISVGIKGRDRLKIVIIVLKTAEHIWNYVTPTWCLIQCFSGLPGSKGKYLFSVIWVIHSYPKKHPIKCLVFFFRPRKINWSWQNYTA